MTHSLSPPIQPSMVQTGAAKNTGLTICPPSTIRHSRRLLLDSHSTWSSGKLCTRTLLYPLRINQSGTWSRPENNLQATHRPTNAGNTAHWHKGLQFTFRPDPGWQISFSDPNVTPWKPDLKTNHIHYGQSRWLYTTNALLSRAD